MIRTVIVDDESLAREGIRMRLQRESDVEVVGEAGDGPEAVRRIDSLQPDVVFLDIQMPAFDGFEVLRRVGLNRLPIVVFVTAHDRYAVQAFESHALDYLLKPVGNARFEGTLKRIRQTLDKPHDADQLHQRTLAMLESNQATVTASGTYLHRLTVKDGRRYILLRADEIDWIEAAANYVQIHARGRLYLVRKTLNEVEERLNPATFARIHRCTIINLDRVQEIVLADTRDLVVKMQEGSVLRLSRGYRDRLLADG